MIDKLSANQRMLLAATLSIFFFLGYQQYMVAKYPPKIDTNSTKTTLENNITSIEQNIKAPITNNINSATKTNQTSHIATIKSKNFEIKIDNLGRISHYYLNDKKYNEKKHVGGIYGSFYNDKNAPKEGYRAQLIDENFATKPLEMRFSDSAINEEAFKTSFKADHDKIDIENEPKTITLTQNLSSLTITKKITFYPDGHYNVDIKLSKMSDFFITPGARPNLVVDGYTFHGIIVQKQDENLELLSDGDVDILQEFKSSLMISASDRYYTTVFYDYENGLNAVVDKGTNGIDDVFIKSNSNIVLNGYIGPKDHKLLKSINPKLTDVIEYGWFTFIAKPVFSLLEFIHGLFGNWGWSIVAMTFLIRFAMFPLTYKGMVSMNKLKELQPKIKELQTKYKGDPQKLNMHIMDLYKKNGANPMGGCLPILLQIPIFFAIYRVLLNAIELKDAEWILWVSDLSRLDTWFILPIAMGITMFIHQHLTPTNFTDPMQEKIMKFLPLIFTFFFVTFPAGLTLYWFTNNIFSIAQQLYVNKLFKNKKAEKKVNEL